MQKDSIVDVRLGSKYTRGFHATELFNCISDGNISSSCKKQGKRFSYYIDIFEVAVLLKLICEKGKEVFGTLLDTKEVLYKK